MEIDEVKETEGFVADELSFDQLPNEILLMIFRSLDFRSLLRASAVNHRWNELAFFLLQNRVSLRLGPWALEPGRVWNRTYTAVSFRHDLDRNLDPSALHPLAEDVRKLELTCDFAVDGSLLELLRPFNGVETLLVNIDRLLLSKSPHSFLRKSRGLLASVRHLILRCRYVRIAGLLAQAAPRLVTLDVELVSRLLPNFYACRFDCLQSLTLRFKLAVIVHSWSLRGKQDLIQCLRQIVTLRKLGFYVDSDFAAFEVPFAVTTIEELALGGKFKRPFANFSNLAQITNLRTLSLDFVAESLSFRGMTTNPLRTLETLRITGNVDYTLPAVAAKFPNLKVLSMASTILSDQDVQAIVGSTWQNTMEDLTIEIASIAPNVISCFVLLQKLKKLCLFCLDDAKNGLSQFNAIVAMDTMKELRIGKLYGTQWWKSAAELGKCNPNCAVFIDNMSAKSYGRTLERVQS